MLNEVPRRKFIVDSSRQYKVLALIAIYVFIAVLLTGALMFLPSIIGLSNKVGQEQYAAAKEVLVMHKRFWPSIFIVVVILGGHSIFLCHRLFGPLYRMNKALKHVSEGNLNYDFKLRKKDFLKQEEKNMDAMIHSLREKIGTLKKDNIHLQTSLNQLSSALDNQDISLETVKEKLVEICRQEEKIVQGFDSFRIDNN